MKCPTWFLANQAVARPIPVALCPLTGLRKETDGAFSDGSRVGYTGVEMAPHESVPEAVSIVIPTHRGNIEAVYHPVEGARAAVIWVGGTDGGVMGPADAVYQTLAVDLAARGIASLRIAFRVLGSPGNLAEGVHDAQVGIQFLAGHRIDRVGLVGHSFGGAVVITAAAGSSAVVAVVTLSSQTAGTRAVPEVSPRPLLLVHGQDDDRLPLWCSENIYSRAREPKELVILPGARHSLRQRREELRELLNRWLVEKLVKPEG